MQARIFETLKTVLRARKITYAELARRLDTSEPTIKRVFAASDDKLSRIVEICDALGLSLEDVVAQAKRTTVTPVMLGDRIEAQLAGDPSLFNFFILLHDGMPVEEIARQFKLEPGDTLRMGQQLERLGLAEVQATGRIRLLLDHPIRFRRDGPLHRALMKINLDFVRQVFLAPDTEAAAFLTQSRRISEDTARHMMTELRKLNRALSEMARQDQLTLPASALKSYKLSLAWSHVQFSSLLTIEGK
ncbi:helix-turn-helix transcriptional regulator [Sulfitobacter sp. 20_GPM-1509m]|uniref:helix-turn-helix domain-containing protein n=1 Tax=Sulfitobacter sp. 20_GPM-1509m TaxID=1380367 RepID=UPI0004902EF7|nr:helix-turn-helix transcriptional regulator [Sulfitobacter sp. 20_GPM-1509m]